MAKQSGVWGIDIGQCALKAIRLEVNEGEVTATAFDYVEHPKILSQPDADPDQLTREALEKFLERNPLKGDAVVVSVSGQSGLARFVKLPPVEEKKITDVVRFEARQQIPFPLEEVVWDYQKISSGAVTDGFAMETEIGLFAIKKETVYRAMQHFKDVKVEVNVIQMAPLALCNYLSYDLLNKGTDEEKKEGEEAEDKPKGSKKSCIVALDIGTDSSNLVVTDGERIIWQRPIPLGGNHFTRALSKDLKLTFAKAEHVKRNATKSPDLKKILLSLRPVLNDFVGETQRSLGYFTTTHRDAKLEYMVGLGNAFRLPGLQKFLSEKLQVEVRKLAKLERLGGDAVVTDPAFTQNVMSFAVAYGLALQGLKKARLQTNLLPQEVQVERMVKAKKPWALAAAVSFMVGATAMMVGYSMQFRVWADENLKTVMKKAESTAKEASEMDSKVSRKEEDVKAKQEEVLQTVAGFEERLDWILLNRYINSCVPVPGLRLDGTFKDKSGGQDGTYVFIDRLGKEQAIPGQWAYILDKENKFVALDKANLAKGAQVTVVYQDFLPDSAGISYWDDRARQAFLKYTDRQSKGKGAGSNAADDGVDDLIQVNVEAVSTRWSTDLKQYFSQLQGDERTIGMTAADLAKPPDCNGWVVEVRGFTYHRDEQNFLINTILDNINRKAFKATAGDGKGDDDKGDAPAIPSKTAAPVRTTAPTKTANPFAKQKDEDEDSPGKTPMTAAPRDEKAEREKMWEKVIVNKVHHACLYDVRPYKVLNMQAGGFRIIKTSPVTRLVNPIPLFPMLQGPGGTPAPGPTDVDPWKPVSEIEGNNAGGGGAAPMGPRMGPMGGMGGMGGMGMPFGSKGERPKDDKDKLLPTRTEFIILFIWQEPTPSEDLLVNKGQQPPSFGFFGGTAAAKQATASEPTAKGAPSVPVPPAGKSTAVASAAGPGSLPMGGMMGGMTGFMGGYGVQQAKMGNGMRMITKQKATKGGSSFTGGSGFFGGMGRGGGFGSGAKSVGAGKH